MRLALAGVSSTAGRVDPAAGSDVRQPLPSAALPTAPAAVETGVAPLSIVIAAGTVLGQLLEAGTSPTRAATIWKPPLTASDNSAPRSMCRGRTVHAASKELVLRVRSPAIDCGPRCSADAPSG